MNEKHETAEPRGEMIATHEGSYSRRIEPPVDIYENESEILVLADMPGVEPDAVDVGVDGSELRVRGNGMDGGDPIQRVLFERVFRIPLTVDPQRVEAGLKSGVLHIRLGKRATASHRKIEVHAG